MNNLSHHSSLDLGVVPEQTIVLPGTVETFAGTMFEDFATISSTSDNKPGVQLKDSESLHGDDSLPSTYQPVVNRSIIPIHQLLF